MPFTQLAGATAAAKALAPTACTTIEEIGSTGIGGLTLGFLALTVTTIVMVAKAANADPERRKYYFCNTFICGIATFAYFSMLSGQGWTAISGCRQFFYAHYVDWILTTPLIILNLGRTFLDFLFSDVRCHYLQSLCNLFHVLICIFCRLFHVLI
jgi:bacteriorhodopsin